MQFPRLGSNVRTAPRVRRSDPPIRRAALLRTPCERLESRTLLAAGEQGLYGQYYDNADFTALSFTRDDPTVNFDWQRRAPLTRMGSAFFSVRWIGQVRGPTNGVYQFRVDADTAPTLRVRGETLALQPLSPFGTTRVASIFLPAGQPVDIQLDYTHGFTSNARVSLAWTLPGETTSTIIPREAFLNSFSPPSSTFSNPVIGVGADPWVVQWNDEYIYVWSDGGRVWGSRAARLQDISPNNSTPLYTPPQGTMYSSQVWAPELHRLDGKWYLYFAASDGDNANHRMYVAERTGDDPLGVFSFVGKIAPTTDRWAIDGTVMELNGSRYFLWSGWQGFTDGQQNLYIAPMSSPTTISGNRTLIAAPTLAWERHGLPINEGPQVLQRNGATHIIYSGSGYWTNEYSLGQLTLTGTTPLSQISWTKKSTPVFTQGNGVTGVGHASFTKSPDRTEDWIVYHAHRDPFTFVDDRVVRAQPFTWNSDNTPNFGAPVPNGAPITEPSGTATFISPLFNRSATIASSSPSESAGDERWATLVLSAAKPLAAARKTAR